MKKPYSEPLEKDKKYFWCTCGASQKLPFCDGAHKELGLKSLMFEVPNSGSFFLCGCQKTKTPPFCDGSHKSL
ncbi:MAG: CDGSH iron-sulfur domain-containing protein [Proteobacteria bacterium]|nr:CDGSH iron-sulfur domain-containing protein [Pseudomonadota bacterium]